MLIILVSFLIIVAVVTSIISNYSHDNKVNIMANAANASSIYIQSKLEGTDTTDISSLVNISSEDIEAVFTAVSSNGEDLTVILAGQDGEIFLSVGQDSGEIKEGALIPQGFMSEIHSGSDISKIGEMEGVFDSKHMLYGVPIYNSENDICGTVFVATSSVVMTDLIEEIIRAIIMAMLWIFMAALIAVYFISERVIGPLRKISVAARQFASGKFDTRVPVTGRDEVAELAEAFNNMAEALDNYDTMRNTFISNVSHDLRTPMTSISGFIDGIIDGVIPPEKHDYYLRIVSSEVKRLSRLVASLLDLSRIQAGERKFNPAPFDICEMGRQIIISFEQKIEEKRLDVDFDCEEYNLTVNADKDAIYQILYNLCDNAVKFSREGGLLRLTIKRTKNKKVLISVYNDGNGIAPADLPYVFERFYKSDKSRGLNKTGVGLGLYISKTIIDAHGEKIWVESEFEKNCCFSFTLSTE